MSKDPETRQPDRSMIGRLKDNLANFAESKKYKLPDGNDENWVMPGVFEIPSSSDHQ